MPLSQALKIYYTVAPMTTSFFSVVGSSVIMTMIFISKKKFGDPYRRIIFGISFFDLLQSLSILFKVFKTTPEQPNAWIALGNQTSCDILGWMNFAGLNGALFYNVSLNIYLLCLIKYNMTAKYYRTRIEPFLHGVPILWAIITSSILVTTGSINPAYAGECLIAPYPINCMKDPDVECIRGQNMDLFRTLFRVVPTFISMIMILFTLGILWWTVRVQEKKMDSYRMSVVALRTRMRASGAYTGIDQTEEDEEKQTAYRCFINFMVGGYQTIKRKLSQRSDDQEDEEVVGPGLLPTPLSASRRSSSLRSSGSSARRHGRPFLVQAGWYALAFILTHTCPIIVVCTEWGGNKPPVAVVVIAKILVPLQGLFNIFIYTRPHVQKERRKNPRLGYWRAFFIVIKSGGDDDDDRTNRFRDGPSSARALALSRAASRNRSRRHNTATTSPGANEGNRSSTTSISRTSAPFSTGRGSVSFARSSLGSARSDNSGNINFAGNSMLSPTATPSTSNQLVPAEIVDDGFRRRMSDLSNDGVGAGVSRHSQRLSKRVSILEAFDEVEEVKAQPPINDPKNDNLNARTAKALPPQDLAHDHDNDRVILGQRGTVGGTFIDTGRRADLQLDMDEEDHDHDHVVLDQRDTVGGTNIDADTRADLQLDTDEEENINLNIDSCNIDASPPPRVFKLNAETPDGEDLDEAIISDQDIESNSSFSH